MLLLIVECDFSSIIFFRFEQGFICKGVFIGTNPSTQQSEVPLSPLMGVSLTANTQYCGLQNTQQVILASGGQ